jgi:hypothetical protein
MTIASTKHLRFLSMQYFHASKTLKYLVECEQKMALRNSTPNRDMQTSSLGDNPNANG